MATVPATDQRLALPTEDELGAALRALRAAVEPTLRVKHLIFLYRCRCEQMDHPTLEEGEHVPMFEDIGRLYSYQLWATNIQDEIAGCLDLDDDLRYLDEFRPAAAWETVGWDDAG